MKTILYPTAALFAMALAAPAMASSIKSDRGYDDLKSYPAATASQSTQSVSTRSQPAASTEAARMFNKKFGSPHPNFESGRR